MQKCCASYISWYHTVVSHLSRIPDGNWDTLHCSCTIMLVGFGSLLHYQWDHFHFQLSIYSFEQQQRNQMNYLRSWQSRGLHWIVVLTPVSVAPALLVISLVFPSALLQRWFISLLYKPPWTPAYYLPLWISWGWVSPFVESSESLIVWRGVWMFPYPGLSLAFPGAPFPPFTVYMLIYLTWCACCK